MKLLPILLLFFSFSLMGQDIYNKSTVANAVDFIYSLNKEQKKKVLYHFNELNRYEWHYFPASMIPRQGIAIKDLESSQKEKAYNLLRAFLSKQGYDKTKNIMALELVLHELQPNNGSRVAENYWMAIYGTPNKDSVWGWKFSGHHLALNFTVIKDDIAFAPFFFGADPASVSDGWLKGLQVMKAEESLGFELINMLTPEQKQKAIFRLKAFTDIVTSASTVIKPLSPEGILANDMTHEQKAVLNKLIAAYLSSVPARVGKARMNRIITEDLNSLRFGWAGATVAGKPHYYRVQGKTFLIEFDNTQNNANHIHSVWRDFNGDYGLDLLKEHYQNSQHHNRKYRNLKK